MKKLLLFLPTIALLAVGCHKISKSLTPQNNAPTVSDTVLINKDSDPTNYLFDIHTKQLTPAKPDPDISQFSGLPKAIETKKNLVENQAFIISNDGTQVIGYSSTHDKTRPESEFDGSYPITAESYYLCDVNLHTCSITHLLDYANNKLPELKGCWFQWDSQHNWLFGRPCGEGGGGNYIAKYDAERKTIQKVGNDYPDQGKTTITYGGSFSPSLEKFFITSEDSKTKKTNLLVYTTSDMSKPAQSLDITPIIQDSEIADPTFSNGWTSVWTRDEKTIFFATTHKIYALDLLGNSSSLKATDISLRISDLALSSTERYVIYVSPPEGNGVNQIMKAVDLRHGNEIVELLNQDFITLRHSY